MLNPPLYSGELDIITDVHEKPLLGVPEMTLHVREMTLQILVYFLVRGIQRFFPFYSKARM